MTRPSPDKVPQTAPQPPALDRGNALGGRGGPEDELLADGQEEVFSRTEVELGRIEHQTDSQSPPHGDDAVGGRR